MKWSNPKEMSFHKMTREKTYREEFSYTVYNWKHHKFLAGIFIGIVMLSWIGVVVDGFGVFVPVAFLLMFLFALQQRRLNKKHGLGIFNPHSKSTRNILGWKY